MQSKRDFGQVNSIQNSICKSHPMDERTTLRILRWAIGTVLALAFVLNAIALAFESGSADRSSFDVSTGYGVGHGSRAEAGDAEAQYQLGATYALGQGVPRNYKAAVSWFRRAAEQDHIGAAYNLGVMYAGGRGVRQDFAEALRWYRKAADQGHTAAQASLGALYALGRGVEKDDANALAWFRKAADQGDAGAEYNLGVMYAEGRGVSRNLAEAAAWYSRAADQGNASAQSNLGAMYSEGSGVPQDSVLAYMWLSLAAASGSQIAARNLDIVAGNMSPKQFAEAQELAREWSTARRARLPKMGSSANRVGNFRDSESDSGI
jgi:TPR repeat protein